MENNDFADAVAALASENNGRDYIVISHQIDRGLHYKLSALLEKKRQNDSCTLFLTTYGGDPNGGYRIARCLRHNYKHIRLVVGSFCKSAGTLVAISADELAIGDLGELGPLDIQVRKDSELAERSSGLDITQALQNITLHAQNACHRMLVDSRGLGLSTKLCAEFAGQVAAGIAAPLFSQIDPIRLGEMQRATRVAFEYGQRLDAYRGNLKEGALNQLIAGYPAHGFVIDRKEASELFRRVTSPTVAELALIGVLWDYIADQSNEEPLFIDLAPTQSEDQTNEERDDRSTHAQDVAATNEERPDGERSNGDETASDADGQGVRVRADERVRPARRRSTAND